ncbi:heavy-metal-associated domain-containing protein [Palaeococcus ferrophilus]|uniref:heavy-metal-associated domain-containing protein n=1 Tax=Palaeococcus ferrophilus TaxID=83868 RepID=UPI00064E5E1D|nr:heavy-metal-associated domain-containing protein [Palaeococcus ferrophilus]
MKAVLLIPDMESQDSLEKVREALESLGVMGEISLERKTAVIDFNPRRVTIGEIMEAIRERGFNVKMGPAGC